MTPDAVRELYSRIEKLEADLARRNAQAQISSQASPGAIGTATRTVQQDEPWESGLSPTVTASVCGTNSRTSPAAFPSGSLLDPESLSFHGQHGVLSWYFKGMPILSEKGREWMSSRTGEEVDLARFLFFNSPVDRRSPIQLDIPRQELGELPGEHATRKAIDILHSSSLRFSFPVPDRDLFQETLAKAYTPSAHPTSPPSQAPAKACVWALHAITNRFQRDWNSNILTDGEECARRAQAHLGLVAEESSIETLQAVLLLVSQITCE